MNILFATNNKEKFLEVSHFLSKYGIEVSRFTFIFSEPAEGTVQEIALLKLQQVMDKGYDCVMVDDAGIFFKAYPAFPGVMSKRIFHLLGYKGMSKLLYNENKEAWFEGAIALFYSGQIRVFTGKTYGTMTELDTEESVKDVPFDAIFKPVGAGCVLQKMTVHQKCLYSYRIKALRQMVDWIKNKNRYE